MNREILGSRHDPAMPRETCLTGAPIHVGVALKKAEAAAEEMAKDADKIRKRHLCRGWESNPHAPSGARDFESRASACSATSARQSLYPRIPPGPTARANPIALDHHLVHEKPLLVGRLLHHMLGLAHRELPHSPANAAYQVPMVLTAKSALVVGMGLTKLYFSYQPGFFQEVQRAIDRGRGNPGPQNSPKVRGLEMPG